MSYLVGLVPTIILEYSGLITSVGSQFQVQPSGSFPYIMFTEDPTQTAFPVPCHAQLVAGEPNGSIRVDDLVGVTFTSNMKVAAKTFSSSASSSSTSSSLSLLFSSSAISSSKLSSSSSKYHPHHRNPVPVLYRLLPLPV